MAYSSVALDWNTIMASILPAAGVTANQVV